MVLSGLRVLPGRRNLTRHATLLPSIRQRNLHKGSDLRMRATYGLSGSGYSILLWKMSFSSPALCFKDRP